MKIILRTCFLGSSMENNKVAGIRHHPRLDGLQQREIAGWFKPLKDVATQYSPYNPIFIPFFAGNVDIEEKETKYFITQRVLTADPIKRTFFIRVSFGKFYEYQESLKWGESPIKYILCKKINLKNKVARDFLKKNIQFFSLKKVDLVRKWKFFSSSYQVS